jgi:hypothetical protein
MGLQLSRGSNSHFQLANRIHNGPIFVFRKTKLLLFRSCFLLHLSSPMLLRYLLLVKSCPCGIQLSSLTFLLHWGTKRRIPLQSSNMSNQWKLFFIFTIACLQRKNVGRGYGHCWGISDINSSQYWYHCIILIFLVFEGMLSLYQENIWAAGG